MIRQATIQDLDQLTTLFDQYLVFYQNRLIWGDTKPI